MRCWETLGDEAAYCRGRDRTYRDVASLVEGVGSPPVLAADGTGTGWDVKAADAAIPYVVDADTEATWTPVANAVVEQGVWPVDVIFGILGYHVVEADGPGVVDDADHLSSALKMKGYGHGVALQFTESVAMSALVEWSLPVRRGTCRACDDVHANHPAAAAPEARALLHWH